jgi:hypothetical protein
VGSIPASRTKIRKTKGLKSNLQAFFLCYVPGKCWPEFHRPREGGDPYFGDLLWAGACAGTFARTTFTLTAHIAIFFAARTAIAVNEKLIPGHFAVRVTAAIILFSRL